MLRRGLLYCMEYLEDNLEDWLGEELQVGLWSSSIHSKFD
jgi:hypothetical protein